VPGSRAISRGGAPAAARGGVHDGRWGNAAEAGSHYPEIDHPQFYRVERHAAAIVAHSYADLERPAALAQRYGLTLETPTFHSWYLSRGQPARRLYQPGAV
jgi:hypothetical protein